MSLRAEQKLQNHFAFIYGENQAAKLTKRLMESLAKFKEECPNLDSLIEANSISEKDIILIAYGDIITESEHPSLQTLHTFLEDKLKKQINAVHILPFYIYSSDDGFSVIDYRTVEPAFGTWKDIRNLGNSHKLMVDAVINHISKESSWFKAFLDGDSKYQDYFIVPDELWDLSNVSRPRTSPLLTEFKTKQGSKKVWTTFSADQIDLNYSNPEILLEILNLLLFYISQGASIIRLDAIAYLWKQSGTTCIHLPQTHRIIKIMRLVLEMVAPHVVLITDTNVPHTENISYFGSFSPDTEQTDEAHMVYQFPLAPLVLHTLQTGNSAHIHDWVENLETKGLFFNFIASHDGIGVLPAIGILSKDEVEEIITQVIAHGGLVSNRSNPDGTQTVYELNTTLFDALSNPKKPNPELDIARFLASQVILLSLAGMPGIYYHSLFGSQNSIENVKNTGRARSINREKFSYDKLEALLRQPTNIHTQVFEQYRHLLSVRTNQAAFHPKGKQKVVRVDDRVFGLERESPDLSLAILTLVNISQDFLELTLDSDRTCLKQAEEVMDLISGEQFTIVDHKLSLMLKPYQAFWLREI